MYNLLMKKLDKKITITLLFAIISAILFVGGIPMIIMGAGKNTFVMVTGIIFTALDFYACPVLFSCYGSLLSLKNTAKAVNDEHIYDIEQIAVQTGKNADIVKADILKCLEKGYITGLLFDGEKLTFNQNKKADRTLLKGICPNCGAPVKYYSDETPVCPYCGTPLNPVEHNNGK